MGCMDLNDLTECHTIFSDSNFFIANNFTLDYSDNYRIKKLSHEMLFTRRVCGGVPRFTNTHPDQTYTTLQLPLVNTF